MSLVANRLFTARQCVSFKVKPVSKNAGAISLLSRGWQTRLASSKPAYEGHVPLNWFEAGFLAVGSAFMSLANPRRGGELSYFVYEP